MAFGNTVVGVLAFFFTAIFGLGATFTVTINSDSGAGSLRQAILDANASPGANTITFSIPGGGVQIIAPFSALPAITNQVSVDATTQPGYAGAPLIVLSGNNSFGVINGLTVSAPGCAIKGFVFGGFGRSSDRPRSALLLLSASNVVTACYIGVSETGTNGRFNFRNGILISNAPGNVIGGLTVADRNLIGVNSTGVFITGPNASNNVVLGNWFSLSRAGTNTLMNGTDITISNAPNNTIGGTIAAARNVLNGYDQSVLVTGGAIGNSILGNYMNLYPDGSPTPKRFAFGVVVDNAVGTVIGGTTAGARNVISGCENAVRIMNATTTGTVVQGNYLGTDVTGMTTNYNNISVSIFNGSSGNLIGGMTAGAGNVILANGFETVSLSGAHNNVVQGNFIGTDATGQNAPSLNSGNLTMGVFIFSGATNNLIGGTNAAARNVIAGMTSDGVQINGTSNNVVQGNYLGVAADGVKALGNGNNGAQILSASSNLITANLIGYNRNAGVSFYFGTTNNLVIGNTIFSNLVTGVTLFGPNVISQNSIYGNGGPGIDRGGDGPTANVPNGRSNFPILTAARQGSTIIDGTLNGQPGCTYDINFYSNPASDPNPQAKTLIAGVSVTLDGTGNATFHYTFLPTSVIGDQITAIATGHCAGAADETSEISASVSITGSTSTTTATGSSRANHTSAGTVGHPVDTFNGELFDSLPPDLSLGGPLPLVFSRYYAAFIKKDNFIAGKLGDNWLHNFEMTLATTPSNTVNVVNQFGRLIQFTNVAGNFTLIGRQDIPFQLATSGANYTLGDPRSQLLYTFDATGKLINIADGHGNAHSLTYTGNQLATVTDGLGRAFTFQYNGGGQLTNVSDGVRSVGYTQNANNLATARTPLGFVTTYSYDGANPNSGLMTAATLPAGNVPFAQTFDAQGRIATQTSAGSNVWSLNFSGATTTVTNPAGNIVQDMHTATGELSAYKDEAGQTIPLASNSSGQRALVTDRLGFATGIAYHAPSGKPAALTNADATLTTFTYAPRLTNGVTLYDLRQMVFPDGTSEGYSYDSNGNMLTRTDRAGNVFGFSYNARGQALTATNPLGGVVTFTYDANGRRATRADTDTGTTTYQYDSLNRLTNVIHPDASTLRAAFDADDRLTSVTDERGNVTQFTYDANGRVTQVADANNQTVQFTYDSRDRIIRTIDRLGQAAGVAYDPLDHVASMTNRNGFVTRYTYDARQRLTALTDPGNQNWRFEYDNENLLSASANPLNQTNRISRDQLGYETGITNALGYSASLVRDSMRRVTQTIDGILRTNRFGYDARGLLTNATKPLIGGAGYQRNNLGELSKITGLNGEQWNFFYTPMGRLQSVTDPLNRAAIISYDARGRLQKTTFADSVTRSNTYDSANNLTRLQFSNGPDLPYTYDALNRRVTADNLGFSYDAEGRLTNTASSGVNYGASYDAGGRLASVSYHNGAFAVNYTYDSRDRLTRVTDTLTSTQIDFTYDEAGRLIGVTRPNAVNGTYTYDAAGRLARIQEGSIIDLQYTLNAAGEIVTANFTAPLDPVNVLAPANPSFGYDAAHQITNPGYSFDARGRQTASPGHAFSWDGASRLAAIDAVTFSYNGANDILTRSASGVTTRYFYNRRIGLAPIMAEKNDTSGQIQRYYVWTPGGRLLYLIDAQNGNAVSYFHFDRVGSTLALTAGNGAITDAYAYSPYGVLLGRTGTNLQPFTYVGEFGVRAEVAANLYHMRARYYDPVSARFLSCDPHGPELANPLTLDPYTYAWNNPVRFVDLTGRAPIDDEYDAERIRNMPKLGPNERSEDYQFQTRIIGSYSPNYARYDSPDGIGRGGDNLFDERKTPELSLAAEVMFEPDECVKSIREGMENYDSKAMVPARTIKATYLKDGQLDCPEEIIPEHHPWGCSRRQYLARILGHGAWGYSLREKHERRLDDEDEDRKIICRASDFVVEPMSRTGLNAKEGDTASSGRIVMEVNGTKLDFRLTEWRGNEW